MSAVDGGQQRLDRRRFLERIALGLGATAGASLLAACQPAAPAAPTPAPKPAAAAPTAASAGQAAPAAASAGPALEADLVAGAQREGSLRILHGMPQPTLEALAAEFKKKYPFLNVEIERQQGLAAYEKFAQETRAGANLRDVVHVADLAGYQRLVADGMILQYRVPTDARFQPAFRIGDARAYIPYKTEIVVPVNDQLVSRAEGDILKTWEGILDPRWKGRVGMVEPAGGTTYAIVMMLLHSPQPNRFGEDFLRKLAEHNPTIYSTTATAIQRLLAGDVHVLFTHWESDALTQLQKGAPIRWYAPSPTPSYGNSPYGISAKAPHANAAKLWQNWFMGEEGARALNTIYNSKSTLDGFTNVVDLPKTDWYMPIQDSFVPAIDDWAKYQTADVDRWSQIFNYKMGSGA